MRIEELKKIADSVDWKPLEKKLSEKVKIPVELQVEVKEYRKPKIELVSQELAESAGVMAASFKSLRIRDFGTSYNEESDSLGMLIDFRWEYKDGGTNGCTILRAACQVSTGEWSFR